MVCATMCGLYVSLLHICRLDAHSIYMYMKKIVQNVLKMLHERFFKLIEIIFLNLNILVL